MDRIHADRQSVKRLGHWTAERDFEVRARRSAVVLDLRSPEIPDGDLNVHVELDRSMVKLLVPEGAVIDTWDLRWHGAGRVKDWTGSAEPDGRRITVSGAVRKGEIRIHRGGIAVLSAMFSREFLEDALYAHRTGTMPTVADPR